MGLSILTDIGSHVTCAQGNVPAAQGAGTYNSAAIDRTGTSGDQEYLSGVLEVSVGATSGSPSSFTVDAAIQDSATGTGGWAALSPAAAITTITAASTIGTFNVNLKGARRYIRVQTIVAFSGGTSPTVGVATNVVLGGAQKLPTP